MKRTEKYYVVINVYGWPMKIFLKKEIASTLGVNIDTVTDWIKLFNKGRIAGLSKLHYEGRRPSGLDAVKDLLLKYIKEQSISKLSELQDFLEAQHSIVVEHSWLSRYCKKTLLLLQKDKTDTR